MTYDKDMIAAYKRSFQPDNSHYLLVRLLNLEGPQQSFESALNWAYIEEQDPEIYHKLKLFKLKNVN